MDWSDRIGRRVRLRDLHIVLAVAESGSMAKASARLSISHPVVSKAISELEQTLVGGIGLLKDEDLPDETRGSQTSVQIVRD